MVEWSMLGKIIIIVDKIVINYAITLIVIEKFFACFELQLLNYSLR